MVFLRLFKPSENDLKLLCLALGNILHKRNINVQQGNSLQQRHPLSVSGKIKSVDCLFLANKLLVVG